MLFLPSILQIKVFKKNCENNNETKITIIKFKKPIFLKEEIILRYNT